MEYFTLHDKASHTKMARHAMDFQLFQRLFDESFSIFAQCTAFTVSTKIWLEKHSNIAGNNTQAESDRSFILFPDPHARTFV